MNITTIDHRTSLRHAGSCLELCQVPARGRTQVIELNLYGVLQLIRALALLPVIAKTMREVVK